MSTIEGISQKRANMIMRVAKAEAQEEAAAPKKQPDGYVEGGPLLTTIVGTACGAGAAIFTVSWIHPIDTIKTRL